MTLDSIRNIYQTTKWKDILQEVNGLVIPFDLTWKRISVAVSGGADSALLLFLLSEIIDKNKLNTEIHVISNIRCWKTKPWQRYNSIGVFDYVQNKFKNIDYVRHENFVPPEFEHGNQGKTFTDEYGKSVSGDTLELRAFAEYIGYTENIDAYYCAVTKNPDIELEGKLLGRDVVATTENFYLTITEHMDKVACHPFRFVDKRWIFNTYKAKKLNKLYEITRSCEGVFSDITYKNYTPGQYVPVCGKCFWCLEREWGSNEFSN